MKKIKGSFEEIWYLVMYEVLLFNYQVKNTVPSSQTPVFGNNFNKIIISIIYRYEIELEWSFIFG